MSRVDVDRAREAAGPADGHHTDYSKPLYVEWLCRSCHSKHHADEREAA